MSRVLYLDCFSGAAGDMLLGACIDAGLPEAELRHALGSLGVGLDLRIRRVTRAGMTATHFQVCGADEHSSAHAHAHAHGVPHSHGSGHHDHGHRTLAEIGAMIDRSALSTAGKARAVALFTRIAEAEAAIHGTTMDQVHLHEVGALDSIVDIAGVVFAFEWFGIEDVVASPLNVGAGTVTMAHGTFPVPAPATLRLLTGAPVYSSGVQAELVTPTGALLVTGYARSFGPLPALTIDRIGYGAGTRELDPVPNVLRIVVGTRQPASAGVDGDLARSIIKVECEIDDMNPQLFGAVSDRLTAAGALDVFLTPVQMKKGRPGTLVTTLAPPDRREAVVDVLFRETTTIGVRVERVEREVLDRQWVDVPVPGGIVRIKVAGRGGEVLNFAPEYDDCLRIATATGRPVKAVQAEAVQAWLDRAGAPQS
jgi:uncharacterized protein (TIGR00299 family) protein